MFTLGLHGMEGKKKTKEQLLTELEALKTRCKLSELACKHAEVAKQESELKFCTLFEQTPVGIGLSTPDGHILSANVAMCQMTGYSEEELKKINLKNTYNNPEDRTRLLECVKKEGSVRNFKAELKRKDGSLYWASLTITPFQLSSQEVFLTVAEDITECEQAMEALQESEVRFRNLTETTSDWIWEVDEQGIYTYSSPKIKELLGYEPKEIIGKTPFDLMPPVEAERVAAEFRAIVESRKPFSVLENTNLHKDGRSIVLETSGVPIFDVDGNFRGYRGIDRDITQRKRAVQEIEAGRRKLEIYIESMVDGLCVNDADGTIVEVNEAFIKMFGYNSPEEMIGKTIFEDVSEKEITRLKKRFVESIEKREVKIRDFEIICSRKDGSEFPASFNIRNLWEKEKYVGSISIARDITQRKRAEQSLVESESKLREQKSALEQKNIALREMIAQIEMEKKRVQDDIETNVNTVISPILERLKTENTPLKYINLLQYHLEGLTSTYSRKIKKRLDLTPREIEICNMVKGGLPNKDIALLLNISSKTVEKHRKNIRNKLGISHKSVNLTSFLREL